jgi:hypothetical protein
MTTLYSLRTDGVQFRITKFVDGEVESSYICNTRECECPAGHRATCRHRQMLPQLLAERIVDTHWFYDFDTRRVVDFDGTLKSNFDAMNELAQRPQAVTEQPQLTGLQEEQILMGFHNDPAVGEAQHVEVTSRPHSPTVTTPDFDSGDAGSIPAVAAKPWRRL